MARRLTPSRLTPILVSVVVAAASASVALQQAPDAFSRPSRCASWRCVASSTTTTSTTAAPTTTTTAAPTTTVAPTTSTTAPSGTSTATPTGTSTSGIYWGAWIGKQLTGTEAPWDMNAVASLATQVGKQPSVVHWSSPFRNSSTGSYYGFQTAQFDAVRSYGAIPFFSWGNTGIRDADVAAGTYDSYIRSWAQSAKSWGHPFFLRYSWEMNGSWFSWGVGNNGTTATDYVNMWRHVHDIFTSVGATNVSWVWCPNIDPYEKMAPMSSVYPGDAYVDWTCLDGYNGSSPSSSFTTLFKSSYDRIQSIAPSKPVIIGEVGATEAGGGKATWITNMLTTELPAMPNIKGLVWFDKYESGPGGYTDWPIDSSASSIAAFATGVKASAYVSNVFASLSTLPGL